MYFIVSGLLSILLASLAWMLGLVSKRKALFAIALLFIATLGGGIWEMGNYWAGVGVMTMLAWPVVTFLEGKEKKP